MCLSATQPPHGTILKWVATCLFIFPTITEASSITNWIDSALPKKGQSIADEIKCYSLPYGGIGFLSHVLTYYTIFILSLGRSPFTLKKNKHWKFDLCLAIIGLFSSVVLSIFTIIRCRQRWEFVLLGVWKADLSATLGFLSLHAAFIVRRKKQSDEPKSPVVRISRTFTVLFWLLLYVPGVAVGFAGLVSLVKQTWDQWLVYKTSLVFAGLGFSFIIVAVGVIVSGIYVQIRRPRWQAEPQSQDEAISHVGSDQAMESLSFNRRKNGIGNMNPSYWPQPDAEFGKFTPVRPHRDFPIMQKDKQRSKDTPKLQKSSPNTRALQLDDGLNDLRERADQVTSSKLRRELERLARLAIAWLTDSLIGRVLAYPAMALMSGLFCVGIFGAFYSDFVVGAMAENMTGVPSSDNSVLFWSYFAAKRLPLFSV